MIKYAVEGKEGGVTSVLSDKRDGGGAPLVLRTRPAVEMNDAQFFAFCQQNSDLRIERTAKGDLVIMPPTAGDTGNRNFKLAVQFGRWVEQDGSGEGFDSSTGFVLPNGATRSPDLAWALRSRLAALTPDQKQGFLPLCPDFVLELRSSSDSLSAAHDKMREYQENGARLGWLLDPANRRVHVYRPNTPVETHDDPATVSGDPELPGFVLNVRALFDAQF